MASQIRLDCQDRTLRCLNTSPSDLFQEFSYVPLPKVRLQNFNVSSKGNPFWVSMIAWTIKC